LILSIVLLGYGNEGYGGGSSYGGGSGGYGGYSA
jgi:hypothetical protein